MHIIIKKHVKKLHILNKIHPCLNYIINKDTHSTLGRSI